MSGTAATPSLPTVPLCDLHTSYLLIIEAVLMPNKIEPLLEEGWEGHARGANLRPKRDKSAFALLANLWSVEASAKWKTSAVPTHIAWMDGDSVGGLADSEGP